MKKKPLTILILVAVAVLLIGGGAAAGVLNYRNFRDSQQNEENDSANINSDAQTEEPSIYDPYPELEPLIGLTLDEVKVLYPGGTDQVSNTTWGELWYSYQYETDLFILYVDGKATKVVDFAGLKVKALKGCPHNEAILDYVDTIVPYGHIDPAEIGTATNPGIYQGAPTYYHYKQGYAVGVLCNTELDQTSTLEVTYFTVPDYYFTD